MGYLHPYNLAFYKKIAVKWLKCDIFFLQYRLKRTFAFNFCLSITNFVFDNLFSVETCFSNICKRGDLEEYFFELNNIPFLIPFYVSI